MIPPVASSDLLSQSDDMSVCEQSFHFSQTAKGGGGGGVGPIGLGLPQTEYSMASGGGGFNPMSDKRGASVLGGIGGALNSSNLLVGSGGGGAFGGMGTAATMYGMGCGNWPLTAKSSGTDVGARKECIHMTWWEIAIIGVSCGAAPVSTGR